MIAAMINAVIAFACLIYAFFAFKEKGPLLTTMYIVATPEQRYKMKTRERYRFVATVFLFLSIIFFLISAGILMNLVWIPKVILGLAVILGIYVVVASVRDETRKSI